MKICPFISHMIDDDRANILQISDPAPENAKNISDDNNVDGSGAVILGYNNSQSAGVATQKAKTENAAKVKTNLPSHLFCLESTCRFYQKKERACTFDSMFDKIAAQKDAAAAAKTNNCDNEKVATKIGKELEKFWKFQTKSVAELIASVGDVEEKQQSTFETLKKQLDEGIDEIKSATPENAADDFKNEFGEVKTDFNKLKETIDSREESLENFSTTVSELVLNIDDTVSSLRDKHEDLSGRIEKLESSIQQMDEFHKKLEESLTEKLDSLQAPSIPDNVKEMAGKFESLIETNRQLEDRLNTWTENLESSIREVSEQQSTWDEHFDDITAKQKEVMAVLQRDRERRDNESTVHQKKEAKKCNNLGVTSFHNGEFEMARDQFLEAVNLDKNFAESYNNLGLVYTELQEEEKATEAFGKAIEINPDLPAVYNNLGYVFYKQGSYDQAIEMYNEALGRSSDNSSAYTNLGNAYFKQGNNEDAKKAWEKAIEIDPSNDKATQNLKRLGNDK